MLLCSALSTGPSTGSSADPGHSVLRVGVSSCCSSPCAHRALISFSICFPYRFPLCPACFPSSTVVNVAGSYVMPECSVRERYEASEASLSGPATRSARENARRRCASSKHAWLGCRYAPRPGCRAWGSGTMTFPAMTRRSRLDFAARSLQPTQVRTGNPPGSGSSDRTAIPHISLPCHHPSATALTPRKLPVARELSPAPLPREPRAAVPSGPRAAPGEPTGAPLSGLRSEGAPATERRGKTAA